MLSLTFAKGTDSGAIRAHRTLTMKLERCLGPIIFNPVAVHIEGRRVSQRPVKFMRLSTVGSYKLAFDIDVPRGRGDCARGTELVLLSFLGDVLEGVTSMVSSMQRHPISLASVPCRTRGNGRWRASNSMSIETFQTGGARDSSPSIFPAPTNYHRELPPSRTKCCRNTCFVSKLQN